MKFTTAAFLLLAGVCSAADPSTTEAGLFKVISTSSNKAPQMLVVKGQIKSLHGTDHLDADEDPSKLGAKRSLEEFAPAGGYGSPGYGSGPGYGHGTGPYPPSSSYGPPKKANDWIVEDGDGPDGSGFEVEEGQLTDFESRGGGRGGRGGSEGICSGHLCYNNVIATVKGATYKYGGEYYGKEYLKLCLVSTGYNSCWTVSCPSVKQVPYLIYEHCTPVDDYDCGCDVYETLVSAFTLKIRVNTFNECGFQRRLQEEQIDGDAAGDGVGTDGPCRRSLADPAEDENGRKLDWCCSCDTSLGSTAEVEIVCGEPRYD